MSGFSDGIEFIHTPTKQAGRAMPDRGRMTAETT
ncbi:hypothetical protein NK6_284 [Bradyrhizobium diazoefficiens]|uniref:Uncharacterized protein n=1 Tax=Bradyrhizobium diazoefficiens TaxID=1355477 RepID=A0A0E4FQH0_9BRAD|nr:hypothetical protein NK6_284 [Bradyrhizobium diazoefficiens]